MAGLAEQYRRHREAFTLALELGCTPKEAEQELKRRAARERNQAAQQRLAQKMAGDAPKQTAEIPQHWWMKD